MVENFKRFTAIGYEYFMTNEWKFRVDNMTKLIKFIRASGDYNDFNVDIRSLDWDAYIHQYILGIRKYILKDDPNTLSNARSHLLR